MAANHTLQSISAYFNWLAGEGILEANTAEYVNKAATNGPRTACSPTRSWPKSGANRRAYRRRGHPIWNNRTAADADRPASKWIGHLKWSEIDLDKMVINLPTERVKNHARALSLSLRRWPTSCRRNRGAGRPMAASQLLFGADWGSSIRHYGPAKVALDDKIGENRAAAGVAELMPRWTLHDFRRTISTRLNNDLGIAPDVVEAILGHAVKGVAGI